MPRLRVEDPEPWIACPVCRARAIARGITETESALFVTDNADRADWASLRSDFIALSTASADPDSRPPDGHVCSTAKVRMQYQDGEDHGKDG